ncbi:MAG: hypothetical protein U1F33_12100 [Alphaproteobacteria bacterium]
MRLNFSSEAPTVEVGHEFRHRRLGGGVVETARVVGLLDDRSGIPHVRFMVSIQRINRTFEEGPRTLSLSSFLRHYNENV